MKIWHLTEDILGHIRIGKYDVAILSHVKDRLKDRNLNTQQLSKLVKSIPKFENEIDKLDFREGFFIIDQKLQISIGASRYGKNKITVITIINSAKPYTREVDKFFYI